MGGTLYLGGTLVTRLTTKVEWHVFIGSLSESTITTFVSPLFWSGPQRDKLLFAPIDLQLLSLVEGSPRSGGHMGSYERHLTGSLFCLPLLRSRVQASCLLCLWLLRLRYFHTWTVLLCSETEDLFHFYLHISFGSSCCTVRDCKVGESTHLHRAFLASSHHCWLCWALWESFMTTTAPATK